MLRKLVGDERVDAIKRLRSTAHETAEGLTDVQRLLRLIGALCAVAPVYFAPGNHELSYMDRV